MIGRLSSISFCQGEAGSNKRTKSCNKLIQATHLPRSSKVQPALPAGCFLRNANFGMSMDDCAYCTWNIVMYGAVLGACSWNHEQISGFPLISLRGDSYWIWEAFLQFLTQIVFQRWKHHVASMAWRLGICMSEGFLTHDHVGCLNVDPLTVPFLKNQCASTGTARKGGYCTTPVLNGRYEVLHCRKLTTACGTRPSIIMQQPADKGMRLRSFSVHDSLWHCRIEFQKIQQTILSWKHMDVSSNGGTPKNTTKMMILVGKTHGCWLLGKPTI